MTWSEHQSGDSMVWCATSRTDVPVPLCTLPFSPLTLVYALFWRGKLMSAEECRRSGKVRSALASAPTSIYSNSCCDYRSELWIRAIANKDIHMAHYCGVEILISSVFLWCILLSSFFEVSWLAKGINQTFSHLCTVGWSWYE